MQGDIIGLVNESGAVVVRYYYDAWGKLLQTEVSVEKLPTLLIAE
jgi:YD repeat-containing protein